MMNRSWQIAEQQILTPSALDTGALARVMDSVLGHAVDAAELYFQANVHEAWSLEDGQVKDASFSVDRGVGVRAMAGEKTGFAYSADLEMNALLQAAGAARSIARLGQSHSANMLTQRQPKALYPAINPINSLSESQKIDYLRRVDAFARSLDPRVVEVQASFSAVSDTIIVAHSDGTLASDVRPLVRFNISVIVEQSGERQSGYAGGGGRYDFSQLLNEDFPLQCAREAVRQALVNLEAIDAPAGVMPVVLGPGWPGVLLHEAVGHGLEGDFNRKGSSAFSGRIGQQVASPLCTVVDDGTLFGRRGSLSIDDEGTPTQCTTLIENGILRGYMQDKQNAKLMGVDATGNGRRESYAHLPMPRMTNTYMLAGPHDPEEIIRSVKKGLYAPHFGGGQVDITSGKFVFSASEAYLIEDGKITRPVKGATLIGNGPEVMTKISMVGNDLKLDDGIGVCGKAGQSVPVGVGQPTLKIDQLTVGGTQV
ncbi:microcin-processing peptidase 2 [Permianibacter aggregans]|uniref:Microcin-processing peptidase 2 n=2 Tax=Permianibacter aggregans TaxID=1510150 RepID=A0A4R6UJ69_9GAMM|nr:microcin-processing peptidase 2 [Permianibacter aggregans]